MAEVPVIIDPPQNGYIYLLTSAGSGDVEFVVKGKSFRGNKAFISVVNPYLKSLMDANSGNGPIEVEGVSITAFDQCLKLLGSGTEVRVTVANCIELLVAAVVLMIPKLNEIASKFIVNNINEQIVTQFLKNLEVLSTVDNVEERMVQYLVQHGHKYFDNNHLFQLSVQEIFYICQIEDMIIPSEKYLLERIIQYYEEKKKHLTGEDAEEFTGNIRNIIKYINYGDDCVRLLYRYRLYEESDEPTKVNRVYFTPSSTETINQSLIELYNSGKGCFHLPEAMKDALQRIGNLVDLIEPIVTDKQTNDKTFLNCLTILLECQIEEPFKAAQEAIDCCTRLLGLYDIVIEDHNINYSEGNVLECCLLFTPKYAQVLRDKIGSAKLVTILQYYSVLKEQSAVTMCEILKTVCNPNDFMCLQGLLKMDIAEDEQFWEYICQCVPMGSQNIQFNPVSGAMPPVANPSGYMYQGGFPPQYQPQQIDPNMGYPPQSPPAQQPPFVPPPNMGNVQPPPQGDMFNPPPPPPQQQQGNMPILVDQQPDATIQPPPFFQPPPPPFQPPQ